MVKKTQKLKVSVHSATASRRVEADVNHVLVLDDYVVLTITKHQAQELHRRLGGMESGDCLDPLYMALNGAFGSPEV